MKNKFDDEILILEQSIKLSMVFQIQHHAANLGIYSQPKQKGYKY